MDEPTTPESQEGGEREALVKQIQEEVEAMVQADKPYQEVVVYSETTDPEYETPLRESLIRELDKIIVPGGKRESSDYDSRLGDRTKIERLECISCDTDQPNVRKEVFYWKPGEKDPAKHPAGSVAQIKYVHRSPSKAKK